MSRCKAPEILRSEAYLDVRCNDEGREQRCRWAFFSSLVRGEVSDPTSEGMKQFSLTKNERLHKRHEFDAIFRNGEKYPTEHFLVIIHPNHYERRRLGIVVSKKIGKAVERNRIKRLVREFFRLNKSQFPDSCDLLFVVKRRLEKANYAAVYDELKAMFESHPFKKMQQNL